MRFGWGSWGMFVAVAMTALSCTLLVSTSDLSGGGAPAAGGDSAAPNDSAAACDADIQSDIDNCGTCGTRCLTRANGFPSCAAGACKITCNANFGDCDGNVANGCESALDADGKNCGACGRDCGGGMCVDGACRAVTLVNVGATAQLWSLAIDEAFVYYTSARDGGVYRCAKTGCPAGPQQIGLGNERAYFLAVDATHVYWNNNSTNGQSGPGQVLKGPKGGAVQPPTAVTMGAVPSAANPTQVAVDANNVYWSSNEGTIWRAAKTNGAPVALTAVTNSAHLVAQNATLYITSRGDNSVHACSVSGCSTPPPRVVPESQLEVGDVAGDGTTIFWTRGDGVFSLGVGTLSTKLAATTSGGRIAVSGNDVFWVEGGTKVLTVSKAGGTPRVLATGQTATVNGLAADETHVYWASSGDGTIHRLRR